MSSGTGLICPCLSPRIFTYASKVAMSRPSMCQSGPERKNMPRGIFVFQKSSVLPTTVTGTPRYFAYAAVAIPYGPAPITKSSLRSVSILDHPFALDRLEAYAQRVDKPRSSLLGLVQDLSAG